jgi:hypothetical protein
VTGAELIFTRAMSGGKLTANLAKLSGSDTEALNATNRGVKHLCSYTEQHPI